MAPPKTAAKVKLEGLVDTVLRQNQIFNPAIYNFIVAMTTEQNRIVSGIFGSLAIKNQPLTTFKAAAPQIVQIKVETSHLVCAPQVYSGRTNADRLNTISEIKSLKSLFSNCERHEV